MVFDICAQEKENTLSDGLKVMSYNIRLGSADDKTNSWALRYTATEEMLKDQAPDVFGVQEALEYQVRYIKEMCGYECVGVGRENGKKAGEHMSIFWNKKTVSLLKWGTYWLSETPEVMSKDWDSACYRICSYAILKDKATEREFVVFNTHLDHISDTARINGIQVVLDKIAEFGSLPAVLMGDLNAEEDSETYRSATVNFLDAKYQTENTMTSCTYQNWGTELDSNCIDYVMISKTGLKVNSYKVITETYDGVYTSDHFPLSVSLSFE
mgnify:CR=1 FL=1